MARWHSILPLVTAACSAPEADARAGAAQLERAAGAAAPIGGVPGATDATRVLLMAQGRFGGVL